MGTIIIGGGVIGLSVAYHLGKRGAQDVSVLERNSLTSGTSWHAAGIVGPLRATSNMTRLASYALDLFPKLEAETGMQTGYRRTGGYWLARETERLDELHRICNLGRTQGLSPRIIAPIEVAVPQLDLSEHVGALHVPEDGNVNPVDLCMAYARAARSAGVDIREDTQVSHLLVSDERAVGVALADGSEILADRVVLCAGAWSGRLAALAGVALPVQAVEHMYVVTAPIEGLPEPFPVIRDLDRGIYIKGDAGKLVIGGFEPNAKCWDAYGPEGDRPFLELPEDWEQFAPFMQSALDLMPGLERIGIQHFMNGPESFTADTRPLVGPVTELDGLYVAAGMNSVGVMSSAGIGRALADWIVDQSPPFDMWEVDVARIDARTAEPAHMAERMKEAVSDLFSLHWPYKQPMAGRGLRCSVLHGQWAKQGAVFGLTGGWERGVWYADSEAERSLQYSVASQPWWPITRREAGRMADGAVLLDLSPFTKISISGSGSLNALNQMTSAQLDVPEGRSVYAQFLNSDGGIELDATICRTGRDSFRITSGAATRRRDLAYLRRAMPTSLSVGDETEASCVVGVMGRQSRAVLQAICPEWQDIDFGHRAGALLNCGSEQHICQITRISFVGELGYELDIPNASAPAIFDSLIAEGARPMGHYALEGCRIEKGYKHWGHDLGPDITPLEAGLGFTIDWSKDFIGKDALEKQRHIGPRRRLVLMQISGDALMLHDEPIFEDSRFVGLTTSGAMGPRTGVNLAFGLVDISAGETLDQTCTRRFDVLVGEKSYQARALRNPPFDPNGERMRA